jgi:hypothetical protein
MVPAFLRSGLFLICPMLMGGCNYVLSAYPLCPDDDARIVEDVRLVGHWKYAVAPDPNKDGDRGELLCEISDVPGKPYRLKCRFVSKERPTTTKENSLVA